MTKPKRKKKKTTLTLMRSDFKETPKTVVVSAEPAELLKRYYAVEEIVPLGEAGWEESFDTLRDAFSAYTGHVQENVDRCGGMLCVRLFDRRRRRLLASTWSDRDPDSSVKNWL